MAKLKKYIKEKNVKLAESPITFELNAKSNAGEIVYTSKTGNVTRIPCALKRKQYFFVSSNDTKGKTINPTIKRKLYSASFRNFALEPTYKPLSFFE